MATSLAKQLAQLAANSKSSLNVKAQKAAHSKSLIWEPSVAATQSYQSLYETCIQGFDELCQLDARFLRFQDTLFSPESQGQDRMQLNQREVDQLDKQIDAFLRLVGSKLRLMPAIKALEWMVRRFRIHEENTVSLLLTFLPYHSIPAFATLLSILPSRIPQEFRFLDPYIRSITTPPRSVLVHRAVHEPSFLTLVSEYTLESCRMQYQYPSLISFWAGLITESVSGILDRSKSGRAAIQAENDQALLHRIGPIFAESLIMKKVPSLQIASYMAIVVFVSKANLADVAVTALMEQTVYGWTNETVRPALVCLSTMAQYRSAKQMSGKVAKALMKVADIGPLLVEVGQARRVDKLANGLCLALIERLTKKGDARGLPTILAILSSQILQERQIAVMFKSLLLTALKLNDENDEEGVMRRELGSTLISLSQAPGRSGDIIQSVIQEVDFDIEELEMKLDLSFRQKILPGAADDTPMSNGVTERKPQQDFNFSIQALSTEENSLPSCLHRQPGDLFDEFSHLFFTIVSEQSRKQKHLPQFDQIVKLGRQTAVKDGTYFSFFIRIWCGPYPALARAAAVDAVKSRLKEVEKNTLDVQHLIPYAVVALGDPSKRVRRASADLLTVLSSLYSLPVPGSIPTWPAEGLYGKSEFSPSLSRDLVAKFLLLQLIPVVEECVMDPEHVTAVVKAAIEEGKYHSASGVSKDKKDHVPQQGRLAILTFLAGHAVLTPLLQAKEKLLKSLNEIKGVGSTSRTDLLLPVLQWWSEISTEDAKQLCEAEQVEAESLDARLVDVVVPNDDKGLDTLFSILKDQSLVHKVGLIQAVFARIRKMWPAMKDTNKFNTAEQLLQLSQEASSTDDQSVVSAEASDLLRTVPLTTNILLFFLESVHTGTKMITEPPPNKRRRTSSSVGNRERITQVTPELSQTLRRVTFVLQLVDNSDPISHPELLDALFTTLSELQHFRTVVGSELGYLQNLILRSLLAMIPAYKANGDLKIDSSGGYGDLLVNCVQKSSSSVVQNAALLLIASLATTAPNLVLNSVMPVFTFMGSSVLRQNDDYSAHVVAQTIKEVIPPLIASLRKGSKSPVAGASDILVSFTTAYEHIPAHRRQGLFVALVETLGPRDFLFALVSMLVDRYGPSDALLRFIVDLLNSFAAEVQLDTLVKLLALISDLFKPKPGMSFTLLGINDDGEDKDVQQLALRQLQAYPSFLSSKRLRLRVSKLTETDDMEASEIRQLYATLLENVLLLAETVKGNKALQARCGAALANLLNLLSIGEFIKAVEGLLDRPDVALRQKVLRALEVRVDSESRNDNEPCTALLAFLPQLTAAIRESHDIRYKHTAVTCVDKIAEKYGKKDLEAVVAAASTIAGAECLGQDEKRLRVMALLCLTSLVEVLQDAMVPILPSAIPKAVAYLGSSLEGDSPDEELHSACYGFIASLAEHLPYMLSTYLDPILKVSNLSAVTSLDDDTKESRTECLQFLVRRLEAKETFVALENNWESAMDAGFEAIVEFMVIFGAALDRHSKAAVSKNSSLLASIVTKALDTRRLLHNTGASNGVSPGQLNVLEGSINDNTLKMIYKLNDASFRPIFVQLVEWATSLTKSDKTGRMLRQYSLYGFLQTFFGSLKSIVTSYATYVVDDAVALLGNVNPKSKEEEQLCSQVLKTLSLSFEHDQDDFWQSPTHFGAVGPVLLDYIGHASSMDMTVDLIPCVVELAAAADSQTHQKTLNTGLLKHLKSQDAAVRLAAIKCEQALTERLGEEWLSMLPEMLPAISELQDDDDEVVETETHRWIVKIEGVLGESLDAMLQ